MEFLSDFVKQAGTANLKTKDYPRELLDLRLRVSFGMGTQSRVPWVQIVSPDMPTTNGYYPVYLFYKEQNVLILAYGIGEEFDSTSWNPEIHANRKKIEDFLDKPFRYGNSYVHSYYEPIVKNGAVTFLRDGVQVSADTMLTELKVIVAEYKQCMEIEVKDETSVISTGLFYMEQQLEDFIIRNWDETEFGKKYNLIYEDGELRSQQFQTDIGRIDILAKEKSNDNYVVIELKRNQTSDDTVGQVTRYMGWIKDKFKDDNVKGVIVAGKYDEKLYYAQRTLPNVEVFLYEVNFRLTEYVKQT